MGCAPFSPNSCLAYGEHLLLAFLDLLLVSFLVHGVLAVVCCLFHSSLILLPPPNDLQRQLRGGFEV